MTLLGLLIEEDERGEISVCPEGIYEAMSFEYGGISESPTVILDYGETFENKETFVNFIEQMERKASRENKTLKVVLSEHSNIKFS